MDRNKLLSEAMRTTVRVGRFRLLNLTPHSIQWRDSDGFSHTIPPCGLVGRVAVEQGGSIGFPFPATVQKYGEIKGIPEPQNGVLYVVSGLVYSANLDQESRYRYDLIAPDTGPTAIREDGRIVAVTQFLVSCYNASETTWPA